MNTAPIEAWLRQHCGLEADSLGPGVVGRAARERMTALGCVAAADYLTHLATSAEERQQLIDRVIVPETWFFRDRAALDAVARHAVSEWESAHPGATFRALCVPCSTGEEPYSLAMAFAQAGWPLARLTIDAVDIGRENITRARAGIYRRNSFRGADLLFRNVFLEPLPNEVEAWRVRESVRAPVKFVEGNLLADEFALGRSAYDAIFCRNLLIYFDRATQDRALRTLSGLLAADGWFAVGPAEPVLLFAHGFSALKIPASFLLQRAPVAAKKSAAVPRRKQSRPPFRIPTQTKAAPNAVYWASPSPVAPADTLASIQALADAGQLREAGTRGAAMLDRGATPELLYLLGVIADALGEAKRAEELYRKTLYLEPQHADALSHLALHAEKSGDLRTARTLRARAQRVAGRQSA
jgi:chemotaxis protein methyltransferase WspC